MAVGGRQLRAADIGAGLVSALVDEAVAPLLTSGAITSRLPRTAATRGAGTTTAIERDRGIPEWRFSRASATRCSFGDDRGASCARALRMK
jgi:hypothetical protein